MWNHHGPWLLLAMLGTVACADARSESHGVVLDSVATVVLAEPDSVPMNRIIDLLHSADGSWYLSDNGNDRVSHFSGQGAYLGHLGGPGQGPGEFEAPQDIVQLSTDTIAVADKLAQRITLFVNGEADTAINLPVSPQSLVVLDHTGWIEDVDVSSGTGLLRWDRRDNTFAHFAPVPSDFTDGSVLAATFGSGATVAWPDSVLLLLDGYAWARLYGPDGTVLDSFTVPRRLRRGTPVDLAQRLATQRDFAGMFSAASWLFGSADIGNGWVALMHGDQDYDMASRKIVNPRGYLTLLNRSTHQACVDLPMPVSGDVLPVVAFEQDTLHILDRRITDVGGLTNTITSYLLHPDACPAEAVMQF
jgi:hypothetical protein